MARSSFYRWVNLYNAHGFEGLEDHTRGPFHIWNQIPDEIREHVVEVAKEELEKTPRELAWYITDTDIFRIPSKRKSAGSSIITTMNAITRPSITFVPWMSTRDEQEKSLQNVR